MHRFANFFFLNKFRVGFRAEKLWRTPASAGLVSSCLARHVRRPCRPLANSLGLFHRSSSTRRAGRASRPRLSRQETDRSRHGQRFAHLCVAAARRARHPTRSGRNRRRVLAVFDCFTRLVRTGLRVHLRRPLLPPLPLLPLLTPPTWLRRAKPSAAPRALRRPRRRRPARLAARGHH